MPHQMLIVGDSHSRVFTYINSENLWPECKFVVKGVGGATAQGVVNPNSRTDALNIFHNFIETRATPESWLGIMLGEVDCGFVIWHYAERRRISIRVQMRRSLNNYREFVETVAAAHVPRQRIILLAAPLPTILDNADQQYLAGFRKGIRASLFARTQLTLLYNRCLRMMAHKLGVGFADIGNQTLDPATRTVRLDLKEDDPADHHLSSAKTWGKWQAALNAVFARANP